MELRTYLDILWRERAIVLTCTIVSLIASYWFTSYQHEIYESSASFVMRPRAALLDDEQESVRVLDTLGRQLLIGSTYVEVASSRLIRQRAIDSLTLAGDVSKNLRVDGQVVAGTNVLKISVQGTNPLVVKDYANQIGEETVKYVSGLYDIFELEPLDAATTPQDPIRPKLILNLLLGGVMGMTLGVTMGFFIAYWRTPQAKTHSFDIIDHETGAHNAPYFRQRLLQEISRTRRTAEPFSMALIRLSRLHSPVEQETLRLAVNFMHSQLRDEFLLAYMGDSSVAILLTGVTGESAKELVDRLCIRLQTDAIQLSRNSKIHNVKCSAGVSCYQDVTSDADELWGQCVLALTEVNLSLNGRVSLYSQMDTLFAPTHSVN